MASLAEKIRAEVRMRELLESEGIPEPDEVVYGFGCVRLLWHASKACLVIDIDDYGDMDENDLGLPPPE